jgi:hypothetical protein
MHIEITFFVRNLKNLNFTLMQEFQKSSQYREVHVEVLY